MARRRGMEERIAAVEALGRSAEPDARALVAACGDAASLIVAAAARVVRERRWTMVTAALLAALDRLYGDGADPQCHGKIAVIEALSAIDHGDAAVFLRAARHSQPEPVWGGRQDSATRLRILALDALARLGHPDLYRLVADLMADPSPEVRSAAARVAGEIGGERAALLLRLRLQIEDDDQENAGDTAAALLAIDGEDALPLVLRLFHGAKDAARAAGLALALGASRLPTALPPLVRAVDRAIDPAMTGSLITAIALHRSDAAAQALLRLLADGDRGVALAVAAELRLFRTREPLMAQARAIAAARGERAVIEAVELACRSGDGDDRPL